MDNRPQENDDIISAHNLEKMSSSIVDKNSEILPLLQNRTSSLNENEISVEENDRESLYRCGASPSIESESDSPYGTIDRGADDPVLPLEDIISGVEQHDEDLAIKESKKKLTCKSMCLQVTLGLITMLLTAAMIFTLAHLSKMYRQEPNMPYLMLQSLVWSSNIAYFPLAVILFCCCSLKHCLPDSRCLERGYFDTKMMAVFIYKIGVFAGIFSVANYLFVGGCSPYVPPFTQAILAQVPMVMTAVLEKFVLRKKFSWLMYIGLIIAFTGTLVAICRDFFHVHNNPMKLPWYLYVLVIGGFALGNISTSFYYIENKLALDQRRNFWQRYHGGNKNKLLPKFFDAFYTTFIVNIFMTIFLLIPGCFVFGLYSPSRWKKFISSSYDCLTGGGGTKCEPYSWTFFLAFDVIVIVFNLFNAFCCSVVDATFVSLMAVLAPPFAALLMSIPNFIFLIFKYKMPVLYDPTGFDWTLSLVGVGFVIVVIGSFMYILGNSRVATKEKESLTNQIYDFVHKLPPWQQFLIDLNRWACSKCCSGKKNSFIEKVLFENWISSRSSSHVGINYWKSFGRSVGSDNDDDAEFSKFKEIAKKQYAEHVKGKH